MEVNVVMETPSWIKHFDEDADRPIPSTSKVGTSNNNTTESTWTYTGKVKQAERLESAEKIRYHKSYSEDYGIETDTSTSCSKTGSRMRNIHSAPTRCLSEEEKKTKKRRRRRQMEDTSGYSTTSLSELSEFETPRRKTDRNIRGNGCAPNSKRKDSNEKNENSRIAGRHDSEDNKASPSGRISELSKLHSRLDLNAIDNVQRMPRAKSTTSVGSLQSGRSGRSVQTNKSAQSKNIHNISSDIQRKDTSSSISQIDPFYFIQPEPEPCSRKIRKILGPCLGVLIMLILAASLGAAIYFAVELKKTQEDEIEMLRASLALKITSSRYSKDLDHLSQGEFNTLALDYCHQMDTYYKGSNFKETYRGCEVISIKNEHINFTLFFVEKDATKQDIMAVIQTSAPKVEDTGQTVALVDKFEIELKSAKIKIEHQRTPVDFNKIISHEVEKPQKSSKLPPPIKEIEKIKDRATWTTVKPPLYPDKLKETAVTTSTPAVNIDTTIIIITSPEPTVIKPMTTTTSVLLTTVKPPSKSELVWNPCAYNDVAFYQHPTACNKYFQCEHKKSRIQTCTGDLVYDKTATVCRADSPEIECPDASAAPPKPDYFSLLTPVKEKTTASPRRTSVPKPIIDTTSKLSSIYPTRPAYSREPCKKGKPGDLYPHPDDCSKFIQCISKTQGIQQNCATNLVYDPEKMTCLFPVNFLRCPDLIPCNGIERGYFPHPQDCSKYIQCESGREVLQTCSTGLIWDPKINSCVIRSAASICPNSKSS